ncbi:hypothetical protein ppKF707_3033 [Metapseudomonas furukawaii]|uniref:Uncharacterized protein n=1 Tax=Metapseudomonas furukawaii TaxID=1149133 RepID=A0AAD1FFQ2_METFU|nr:hypothetical protein ppKF707_3033 [Pseudomonas furukawaii]BAU74427.1 hypothetical protein KF707C_27390 [Pseudomonas furukawaii]
MLRRPWWMPVIDHATDSISVFRATGSAATFPPFTQLLASIDTAARPPRSRDRGASTTTHR